MHFQSLFDSQWYLNTYSDVKQANIEPFDHYIRNGRFENRWPYQLKTLEFEDSLWLTDGNNGRSELEDEIKTLPLKTPENFHAAWALARWHASHGRWEDVSSCMQAFYSAPLGAEMIAHCGPPLLQFSGLFHTGCTDQAKEFISKQISELGEEPDLLLAKSMTDKPGDNLDTINKMYRDTELSSLHLKDNSTPAVLDNLAGDVPGTSDVSTSFIYRLLHPCVTVIVPAHNAGETILTVLECIAQQTWRNLEIIVIDDASTDDTYEKVLAVSKQDARVKVIRNEYNQGSYASRNKALSISTGKFITVHDSDDWSHPEKIERQARALIRNKKLAATFSHWVRCEPDLTFFHWRMETGWIYRNMSSLMFRRSVFNKLGYWDRIRVGGDTEYFHRIEMVFGKESIQDVLPGIPLSFGRHSRESLSQHNDTHLLTTIKGIRRDYADASQQWQDGTGNLYLPENPDSRPFPAPDAILTAPHEDTIRQYFSAGSLTPLIDPEWYRQTYPDVAAASVDPAQHYYLHGGIENRDPGPDFSSSGYAYRYLGKSAPGINPLVHYLAVGQKLNHETLPAVTGLKQKDTTKKNILVCAHTSTAGIFGAERSLLDILKALNRLGFNVYVSVPGVMNSDYMSMLLEQSVVTKVLPYTWWKKDRPACEATVDHFKEFINENGINLVYANTIMLYEPLLAARVMNVKSIIHARELPEHDPALCKILDADSETIRKFISNQADYFIANSKVVSDYLSHPEKTFIVSNTINADDLDIQNMVAKDAPVIGMVSSNIPKKGLDDFIEVARILYTRAPHVRCLLIGPENEFTRKISSDIKNDALQANIEISGYIDTPVEAFAMANIILNLSHFQESFGRTVLEAMAARRPVIAYDWGALPELVRDGETGYLVPFRDINLVVDKVISLVNHIDNIKIMGDTGRKTAIEQYGFTQFSTRLQEAINKIFNNV